MKGQKASRVGCRQSFVLLRNGSSGDSALYDSPLSLSGFVLLQQLSMTHNAPAFRPLSEMERRVWCVESARSRSCGCIINSEFVYVRGDAWIGACSYANILASLKPSVVQSNRVCETLVRI